MALIRVKVRRHRFHSGIALPPTGISEHINTEASRYRSLFEMAIATEAVW
jgi:hypothetical protein